MKKTIILFFFLVFSQLLIAQSLHLKSNFPNKIAKDKQYIIGVEIIKSDISAFAQYKQELPAGFTASCIESANANFSIENQIVSFTWNTLPADTIIHISYKIVANKFVNNFNMQGTFNYIVNNHRGVLKSELKQYEINKEKLAANATFKNNNTTVKDKKTTSEENIYNFFNSEE